MKFKMIAAIGVFALCAACGPKPAGDVHTVSPDGSNCPDDGPRLPQTGICQGRAFAYLDDNKGAREPTLPDGCTWVAGETLIAGNDALLYRAASCKGVTTKLAYAAGAKSAELTYEKSAVFGDDDKSHVLIRLFGTDPDPQGALKAAIAELPKAERATCEIQPAGVDTWPSDALVIGPTKAARAKLPKDDGPIAACGPFGLDEDSQTFWRVKQGFAWFFDLGQEELDFDPASMTVITKQADGSWAAKP